MNKLNLFSLEHRTAWWDLIEIVKIVNDLTGISLENFSPENLDFKGRVNGKKLIEHRLWLTARASFVANRVVSIWNKLPRGAAEAYTFKIIKAEFGRKQNGVS